jgi:hypothetical protein
LLNEEKWSRPITFVDHFETTKNSENLKIKLFKKDVILPDSTSQMAQWCAAPIYSD